MSDPHQPLAPAERKRLAERAAQLRDDPDGADEYREIRGKLVQSLYWMLVRLAASIAKGTGQEPGDLVSAGAVGALEAIDRWTPDGGSDVATWCRRQARWSMLEETRRYCRERTHTEQPHGPEPADAADSLAELIDREDAERVRAAVDSLPSRERELVRLIYYEGVNASAVSRRWGISRERVRQIRLRALERLRRRLTSDAGDRKYH